MRIWKQAIALALEIYRLTNAFPKSELYGLASQLRRASVSVASNIAEGKGRFTDREFASFLHYARGSLLEVEAQLVISAELNYVNESEARRLQGQIDCLGRGLNALINSLKKPVAA